MDEILSGRNGRVQMAMSEILSFSTNKIQAIIYIMQQEEKSLNDFRSQWACPQNKGNQAEGRDP